MAGIDLIVDALAQNADVPSRYNDLGNILVETGALDRACAELGGNVLGVRTDVSRSESTLRRLSAVWVSVLLAGVVKIA